MDKIVGLHYLENIIDEKYAEELLNELDAKQWIPITNNHNSRMVQHYGYKYNYKTGNIKDVTESIPNFMEKLVNDLSEICKTRLKLQNIPYIFNQCIVNNYEIGQGISAHIDHKNYGPVIACFTLNSGATMRFRKDNEVVDIHVKPNSLYVMTNDARYKWTHEMTTTKFDNKIKRNRRVSITFRYVG